MTLSFFFFFFNDTATTEIYTLSLHDALPISFCFPKPLPNRSPPLLHRPRKGLPSARSPTRSARAKPPSREKGPKRRDRKSTRLNSSHSQISYAVFCLKKKKSTSCWRIA